MRPPRANGFRDAWCGDLRAGDAGREVRVAGWVHRRRDHGGLVFIDLRDRSGVVQLVLDPADAADAHERAGRLRSEHVLSAVGRVVARDADKVNPNLPTGAIEIAVTALEPLAEAETPPFPVDEETPVDELLRLRHRVIDLRREALRDALVLRHRITQAMRTHLDAQDFLEIETPMLTRSTPEGARDFLVPARMDPGTFYALPQSPQLFKQLFMVGGLERYFQIVRCFRDEDLRADRQPEFTQLDVEMSFVEEDDVIALVEGLMVRVFEVAGVAAPPTPWDRLPYDEALLRYGTDRPDRRLGLEIADVSDALAGTGFKVFASTLASGGVVRGINAGAREVPRKDLDELTDVAQRHGAGGLVWAFVQEDGSWRSPIAKFLTEDEVRTVTERLGGRPGDLLLAVADRAEVAARVLGVLRLDLARRFGLAPEGVHDLCWVVDFPMVERDEDAGRWQALHHPFTAPQGDLGDPGALRSRAYDLILDGTEIAGGSIRIDDVDVQSRVLEIIGMDEAEAQARFGFLLDALRFGAPPHGGIAFGLDRIVAILAGRESIRDVIAFPKTATGADPLTGAPAPVDEAQLRELGVRVVAPRPPAGG